MKKPYGIIASAVGGFLLISVLFTSGILLPGFLPRRGESAAQAVSGTENAQAEERQPLVILDAGHGGEDGGAVSASGVTEKTLNLAVVLRLGDMLGAAGVPVLYTRETDTGLYDGAEKGHRKMADLRNRLAAANAHPQAVFCSVHMNTYPGALCSGTQIFYAAHDAGSRVLAEGLRDAVRTYLQPDNTREIKPAGSSIYVLDHSEGTAVLAECGFLSNPAEAELLTRADYQEKLAAVFCSAILDYLGNR